MPYLLGNESAKDLINEHFGYQFHDDIKTAQRVMCT